ncbi:MAG: sialidase family protein, partial [Promethearchaeota archaeon]
DGKTWSEPLDITTQVKFREKITHLSGGPGVGIQLRRGTHKGRILMPFNCGTWSKWNVYIAYSDDLGKSWKRGKLVPSPLHLKGYPNEVQAVELVDGSVMLNARVQAGNNMRRVAISKDGGETWDEPFDDTTLIEPKCQASILRYTDPLDGHKSRILFSNPASMNMRINGTIRMSYDEGKTWPVSKVLEPGNFAYSCLCVLPDKKIGCLYESGEQNPYEKIVFARFTLEWLTDNTDSLNN